MLIDSQAEEREINLGHKSIIVTLFDFEYGMFPVNSWRVRPIILCLSHWQHLKTSTIITNNSMPNTIVVTTQCLTYEIWILNEIHHVAFK